MADFTDYQNIHELLKDTVDARTEHPAYRWLVSDDEMESVTWNEFYSQVRRVARSLTALGVRKNDKVTILSYSCYRWVLTDLAITTIGAATVGIYQTLPAPEVLYIVNHSDAVLAFAENENQVEKLLRNRDEIPNIRKVVLFSGAVPDDEWVISFDDFLRRGDEVSDSEIDSLSAAVGPEDIAGLVYTSGTTGVPKGAMLTHDNITFTAQSVARSVYWLPADHVFLFLPLAHVFARTCVYTALLAGCTLTFSRSIESVAQDLKTAQPDWFPSVPRIFEKVYSKILSGVEDKGGVAEKIFNWALGVGLRVSDVKLARRAVPLPLHLKYMLATKLVFHKIQAALGGRVRWCISGAAPLNPEIGKFFHAAGILIVEGIGMTENTSFSNINRFRHYKFGSVGPTGPGIEQRIAEDGEIEYRGRNNMKGFYKMPEETAATFTEDGWLKTGDLGEIDKDKFLRITGRKKEIIVTSGGKNIAPAKIEGHIATSRYLGQVCVVGDQRNYLTALVTLDMDNIADYAGGANISFSSPDELNSHPEIVRLIEIEIEEKNRDLPSFESIKKVAIVPEFTVDNGLLTPTMKVKKQKAMEAHLDAIDNMYGR